MLVCVVVGFFFNDTATTEIYTLSLHDALPILGDEPPCGGKKVAGRILGIDAALDRPAVQVDVALPVAQLLTRGDADHLLDRKSTRLNSSHANISYAVFCLKKKKVTLIFPPPYS